MSILATITQLLLLRVPCACIVSVIAVYVNVFSVDVVSVLVVYVNVFSVNVVSVNVVSANDPSMKSHAFL